jgi:hypothetical protein
MRWLRARWSAAHSNDQMRAWRFQIAAQKKLAVILTGHAVRAHRFTAEERFFRISIVAYQKAAQRGFEPGSELDDWLAAEREVDAVEGVNSGN